MIQAQSAELFSFQGLDGGEMKFDMHGDRDERHGGMRVAGGLGLWTSCC